MDRVDHESAVPELKSARAAQAFAWLSWLTPLAALAVARGVPMLLYKARPEPTVGMLVMILALVVMASLCIVGIATSIAAFFGKRSRRFVSCSGALLLNIAVVALLCWNFVRPAVAPIPPSSAELARPEPAAAVLENPPAGQIDGRVDPPVPSPSPWAWALAASALLTASNNQRHDTLSGGAELTAEAAARSSRLLSSAWGVNSRQDLYRTLRNLNAYGHRKSFDECRRAVASLTPAQVQTLIARMPDPTLAASQIKIAQTYGPRFGKKSLAGFDYCRYISLCRWGYAAGYLTEQEAWNEILMTASVLQRTFDSWADMGDNYLVGRWFWSLKQFNQDGQRMQLLYTDLLRNPASPWNKNPWTLPLDQSAPPPHTPPGSADAATAR